MTLPNRLLFYTFSLILPALQPAFAQTLTPAKTFDVKEAKQAVAVDAQHFYVINNSAITKHSKADGKLTATWD